MNESMVSLDELRVEETKLIELMQLVQQELIAETGVLDLSKYRKRLSERGLLKQWDELQEKIKKATPPKPKSLQQKRKEAGLGYWTVSKSYIKSILER